MAEYTFFEKFIIWISRHFIVWFYLPGNFIFSLITELAEWYECRGVGPTLTHLESIENRVKNHVNKVEKVQAQVRDWNKNGRGKTKMCSARSGWRMFSFGIPTYKATSTKIELGNLNEIIELDPENEILTVEPNVSMSKLARILLPIGWTLQVIPELEDLTVGGLITGAGLETSSHLFGIFEGICTFFEIVLPDGNTLNCSKDQNRDMFESIPWSHGTLGFLTLVKIRVMKAKKYVKLQYYPTHSLEETVQTFEKNLRKTENNLFVEGLAYGLDKGAVIVGNFSDFPETSKASYKFCDLKCENINHVSRWYSPWYYKHVEKYLKHEFKGKDIIEWMPTWDYFFRHSKATLWEQELWIPFGNNLIFRYLLGWLLPLKIPYLKLVIPQGITKMMTKNNFVEDFSVPITKLEEFLKFVDNEIKMYPIWLCGAKLGDVSSIQKVPRRFEGFTDLDCRLYVDVGLYGETGHNLKNEGIRAKIIRMEKETIKHKGLMGLYIDFQSEREDFRKLFCHELYDEMRKKYNCSEAFPEVYEKVKSGTRRTFDSD